MMLKELSRNSAEPFQMSGFKVEALAAGSGSHGYKLTPDGKKWMFQCKDSPNVMCYLGSLGPL